jgi:hypothetical protein
MDDGRRRRRSFPTCQRAGRAKPIRRAIIAALAGIFALHDHCPSRDDGWDAKTKAIQQFDMFFPLSRWGGLREQGRDFVVGAGAASARCCGYAGALGHTSWFGAPAVRER